MSDSERLAGVPAESRGRSPVTARATARHPAGQPKCGRCGGAKTSAQVQMAERLGISPSYLNLIEHDQRPLPARAADPAARSSSAGLPVAGRRRRHQMMADLIEVFGDDLFEAQELTRRRRPRARRGEPVDCARGHQALSGV